MKLRTLLILATALTTALATAAEKNLPPDSAQSKIENPKSKIPRPYPLDVCLVTDNDLGSMGEETSIVYEGQVIKFCCAPCEKKFLKTPAKYLAKLAPPTPASPAPEKK